MREAPDELEQVEEHPEPGERLNVLTHGLGSILSVVAGAVLVVAAITNGDPWVILGCAVYSASLVGVFVASTLSHCFTDPVRRRFFRILDQAIIYLLIVGTFTPFALVFLRTGWWMAFLLLMWSIAMAGFFSKILFAHRIEGISIWLYIVLGWMPILAGRPLVAALSTTPLLWMFVGGLCYTIGTVFLMLDRTEYHFHAIWHLCVIAGGAFHYFAIFFFIANG